MNLIRKGQSVILAAVAAWVWCGVMGCAALWPSVLVGPVGVNNDSVQLGLVDQFALTLTPTDWFVRISGLLVFWGVFRGVAQARVCAWMIILTVVGSVTGASLSLLATVVELHATYFMNPPPPNTGRIVMNLLGLAVLIGH
jgi:hypothetical protein